MRKKPTQPHVTTKMLAEEHHARVRVADNLRRQSEKENPTAISTSLWRDAAAEVARICSGYSRARARKRLLSRAKQLRAMAISTTYRLAADRLK